MMPSEEEFFGQADVRRGLRGRIAPLEQCVTVTGAEN